MHDSFKAKENTNTPPPPPHIKASLIISMISYCINMCFVLLICEIRNDAIDGLTSITITIGTITTKNLNNLF